MAPLLMNSADLSPEVRDALRAAYSTDDEQRTEHLMSAARRMHEELALECADVRELVGLPPGGC